MTTTYENLTNWYNKLLDKFGRIILEHMQDEISYYQYKLRKFIERSTEEINLMTNIDNKRYLTTMRNHITQLEIKLNIIKDIKEPVKKTRKTSDYNKFIRDNYHTIKKEHPEWNTQMIISEISKLWKSRGQMGGVDEEFYKSYSDFIIDNLDNADVTDKLDTIDDMWENKVIMNGGMWENKQIDTNFIDMLDHVGKEIEQSGGKMKEDDEIAKWKKQMKGLYL